MKNTIKIAFIAGAMLLAALNTPAKWYDVGGWFKSDKLGATVTEISSATVISTFPAIYNANLNALNNNKVEISDLVSTTTLSSLAVVGAITTGTWNADAIGVAYGGTGSTSLSTNYVMLGNGSSGFKTVAGLGSSGQFLTSQGAGSPPVWSSASVNQTLDYTWTGHHIFSSLFATKSSSTNATTTTSWGFGSINYRPATSLNASSTILSHNTSGKLEWMPIQAFGTSRFLGGTTTDSTVSNTDADFYSGATIFSIPAGSMGATGAFRARVNFAATDSGNNNNASIILKMNGTAVCSVTTPGIESSGGLGSIEYTIYNTTASAQSGFIQMYYNDSTANQHLAVGECSGTQDTSSGQNITLAVTQGTDGGDTETATIYTVTGELISAR